MPNEFVHLHNHTHFSLLDAISTVDDLVNAAVENKMPAVAITDHGVMYGVMEFYKKCKAKGIKPVIGCEVYVAQSGSRHDRGFKRNTRTPINEDDDSDAENADGLAAANINYAHLILLAKNETGYRNLIKLVSIGHREGYYYKPRIDLEVLEQYSSGLIATSACAGGVISCYITRNNMEKAREMTGKYKDIFGDDFYLEIQDHLTIPAEKKVMEAMPKLAKEFGLKLIATNDCHYIKPEHAVAHNIYLNINTKNTRGQDSIDVVNNLRYGTDQVYFKSAKEMHYLFRHYPEALSSTMEVTEKCDLELDTKQNYMPNFLIPPEVKAKTFDEYLEKLTFEGMNERFSEITPAITDRLNFELKVIKEMNFSGYFLIVADFISEAKRRGILVGPGRGSAAGSLVCYCTGITNVNPLDYDLLFERFLNPERVSMPDIDIDFQDDKRDEMIQYAREKYGENSVAQIITFNKLAPRGVLKDVGRVLNFPFSEINELTKHVPVIFGRVKKLSECIEEVSEFKKYFDTGDAVQKSEKKKLFEYCRVLENLNKNSSIHASGIVIAPGEVTDYVPLSKVTGEDSYCTQYDMNQLEDAGLIKIDFLGLKELKVLGKTIKMINEKHGLNISIDNIPLDDKKTYELFSAGSTIGIFQFSKSKMREYLAKLKPQNINELAAMNALYRPGPMKLIPDFIDKKFGRKPITYLHPMLENSLKDTYGIIVFQEQVMQIAREVAGFTMGKADSMRKAMGKKIKSKMEEIKNDFIEGAMGNGVPRKAAVDIYNLILDFADYGFNKSHGVAYSILAFYTAYLKAHFPLEFLSVSMECRKDDEVELQHFANECRKMKIKLCPPGINYSFPDFTISYEKKDGCIGQIIYGLSAIKHVGKAVESIVAEREKNGKFKDFIEFMTRIDLKTINRKTIENLIYAGAFDELESNRKKLLCNIERTLLYGQRIRDSEEFNGQDNLFNSSVKDYMPSPYTYYLQDYEDYPEAEKFHNEKNAVGFYLTGHPLAKYEEDIKKFETLNFGYDVTELDFRKLNNVKMCGVIDNLQVKSSKKGKPFVVFNLVDFHGSGECIAFSNLYEKKTEIFKDNSLVCVEGKAEENGDKIKLIIDNITPMENFHEKVVTNLAIYLNEHKVDFEKLNQLKNLIDSNPGNCNLFFKVIKDNSHKIYKSKNSKVKATAVLLESLKQVVGPENVQIN